MLALGVRCAHRYVAVTLLSASCVGGDLQIVRRSRDDGLHRIAETRNRLDDTEIATVDYSAPGSCILVQGTEILHRVTPVEGASEPRMALGIGLMPANPWRWDKTNMDTFARYDGLEVASYEFYRMKAHALGHALVSLAETTPTSTARTDQAARLRAVAAELERVAALVGDTVALPADDFVGFVDESEYLDRGTEYLNRAALAANNGSAAFTSRS